MAPNSNNRKFWQKLLTFWPVLVALVSGASASYVWVSSQVESKIQQAVREHDKEMLTASHPAMQTRLEALENYWKAHRKETNRIHGRILKAEEELEELYHFAVGDKAADLEQNPLKRAEAAAQARERFRQYVRDGKGLKDAYRHALESCIPRW